MSAPDASGGDALPVPRSRPHHTFLTRSDPDADPARHPARLMVRLRDYVEERPKTAVTFSLTDVLEPFDLDHRSVDERMMYLLGSWQSPWTNKNRWVNPNAPDRIRHSDVVTECECGALMARQQAVYHETPHDADNEHTDDCTLQQRYRARARLCENRAEALRQLLRYGQTGRGFTDRLGLTSDSIGEFAEGVGVDPTALRQEFHQRRANTFAVLLDDGFTTSEVARVYGVSPGHTRNHLYKYTPYTVGDLGEQ